MDWLVRGGIAGALTALITQAISSLLFVLKLLHVNLMVQLAGSLVSPFHPVTATLVHLIIGAGLGIILSSILAFTGSDYHLLKGALFGTLEWLVEKVFVVPLIGVVFPFRHTFLLNTVEIGFNILYGVLAACFIVVLRQPGPLNR